MAEAPYSSGSTNFEQDDSGADESLSDGDRKVLESRPVFRDSVAGYLGSRFFLSGHHHWRAVQRG